MERKPATGAVIVAFLLAIFFFSAFVQILQNVASIKTWPKIDSPYLSDLSDMFRAVRDFSADVVYKLAGLIVALSIAVMLFATAKRK